MDEEKTISFETTLSERLMLHMFIPVFGNALASLIKNKVMEDTTCIDVFEKFTTALNNTIEDTEKRELLHKQIKQAIKVYREMHLAMLKKKRLVEKVRYN